MRLGICRGRKKKENPKSTVITFRVTEEELNRISYLCERLGKTRSEVFRDALKSHYEEYHVEKTE